MFRKPTYAQLFLLLDRLGVQDISKGWSERAFHHPASDTLLAFSMLHKSDSDLIASGDWLSAKTNLETDGLIDGPLEHCFVEATSAEELDTSQRPGRLENGNSGS